MRLNDIFYIFVCLTPESCIMKKNLLGAFVILFVTIALFLMIEDIVNSGNTLPNQNVEVYEENTHPNLATLDQDE